VLKQSSNSSLGNNGGDNSLNHCLKVSATS